MIKEKENNQILFAIENWLIANLYNKIMKVVGNEKKCVDWIDKLGLTKHLEGGYFREIYR